MSDPIDVALEAAREAGAILMERLGGPREIREKSARADLVTDADGASEAAIVKRLRREYPAATILTEESGVHAGSADERWIVDPLDGTTNFAHGYPLFCVSIAYERSGELCAGVVYAPAMGECFTAERGAGAFLRRSFETHASRAPQDDKLKVSSIERVADALTCTGFHPSNYAQNGKYFETVSQRAQAVRRDGSAALDLAYVACGRFDGFWEFGLHAWDVAAGTLLVREAGGSVTRVDGGGASLDARSILATNGRVHGELREVLSGA